MKKILIVLGLVSVFGLWYHRALLFGGVHSLVVQSAWIAGNGLYTEKLARPVPRPSTRSGDADQKGSPQTFSILVTPRARAEEDAATLFRYVWSMPRDELMAKARRLDPSYIANTDGDLADTVKRLQLDQDAVENMRYMRAIITVAKDVAEENRASYGSLAVINWEIARLMQRYMLENYDEQQFQDIVGLAKWQVREIPNPYDDIEGVYWPQSEVFSEFQIDPRITSEADLLSHVPFEKLQQLLALQRDYEQEKRTWLLQYRGGQLSEDDWGERLRSGLPTYHASIRNLLSREEAAVVGLSVVYQSSEANEDE